VDRHDAAELGEAVGKFVEGWLRGRGYGDDRIVEMHAANADTAVFEAVADVEEDDPPTDDGGVPDRSSWFAT
jgi:hypothetical protein